MVLSGWMVHKKEVELKGFIRVFRIPEGVVLDRIKARFNEQESVLTILMPKSVRGIRGVGIEEVKEEEVVNEGRNEIATTNADHTSVGKVEGSGQTMRKKANKERSKKETSAHQAKEKDDVGDKIKEPNIKSRHEKGGVSGEGANRQGLKATRSEVGESSKKGDGITGSTKKGEKKPNIANKKESDSSVDTKDKADDEGKLEITQAFTDHSRPSLKEDDEEAEWHEEKTSPAQTPEDDEATKQTYKEAATLEHKEVKIEKEKNPEENNNHNSSFQILERNDTKDGTMRVESKLQEDIGEIEGLRKSQPDYAPAADHHHDDEEARDGEENIEEEEPKEGKESHGQGEEDNEKDSPNYVEKNRSEEVSQEKNKKHSSRKMKICTPCVVVGSSIILSLVVFAIHWIRSKKRQVN